MECGLAPRAFFLKPMQPDSIEVLEYRRTDDLHEIVSRANECVARSGSALLRLGCSYSDFIAVTNASGDQFMPYTGGTLGREAVDDKLMVATAPGGENRHAIEMHGELYYQRNRPRTLYFFCEKAPSGAGETLIADGVAVHASMAPAVGDELLNGRITYHRRRSPAVWAEAFGTPCSRTVEDYCEANAVEAEFMADGSLLTRYTGRVSRPVDGGAMAFVNNLVTWGMQTIKRPGHASVWVTHENGEPIAADTILTAREVVRRHTLAHVWRQGDILVVDNRRCLHGRNAFNDPERRILLRMGF